MNGTLWVAGSLRNFLTATFQPERKICVLGVSILSDSFGVILYSEPSYGASVSYYSPVYDKARIIFYLLLIIDDIDSPVLLSRQICLCRISQVSDNFTGQNIRNSCKLLRKAVYWWSLALLWEMFTLLVFRWAGNASKRRFFLSKYDTH